MVVYESSRSAGFFARRRMFTGGSRLKAITKLVMKWSKNRASGE